LIGGLRDFLTKFNLRKIILGRHLLPYKVGNITFFINTSNPINLIISNLLHEKDYSLLLFKLARIMEPKTFIIDIGAHIGTYTLRIAKSLPNCEVISFEPFIENYHSLLCSIKFNNLTNVTIYPIALSNFEGHTVLYIDEKTRAAIPLRKFIL
jgi:hypothetical protein